MSRRKFRDVRVLSDEHVSLLTSKPPDLPIVSSLKTDQPDLRRAGEEVG